MQAGFQTIPSSERSSKQKLKHRLQTTTPRTCRGQDRAHLYQMRGHRNRINSTSTHQWTGSSQCAHLLSYSGGQGLDGSEMREGGLEGMAGGLVLGTPGPTSSLGPLLFSTIKILMPIGQPLGARRNEAISACDPVDRKYVSSKNAIDNVLL